MICAIIASEFASTGRLEMHSFHGFVTGKICMADTTASAFDVLNRMAFVTTGNGAEDAALLIDALGGQAQGGQ